MLWAHVSALLFMVEIHIEDGKLFSKENWFLFSGSWKYFYEQQFKAFSTMEIGTIKLKFYQSFSAQIIEPQNVLSWKEPTGIMKSNSWFHTASPRTQTVFPEMIVQMHLELQLAWCCDHFPGETVPVPSYIFNKEHFPTLQCGQVCLEFS